MWRERTLSDIIQSMVVHVVHFSSDALFGLPLFYPQRWYASGKLSITGGEISDKGESFPNLLQCLINMNARHRQERLTRRLSLFFSSIVFLFLLMMLLAGSHDNVRDHHPHWLWRFLWSCVLYQVSDPESTDVERPFENNLFQQPGKPSCSTRCRFFKHSMNWNKAAFGERVAHLSE